MNDPNVPRQPVMPSLATITIHNLRLRTFIGFNPEETAKQQDVVINIEIEHELGDGVFEDRVEDALNYKVVTKRVIEHVESGRFLLLEKLTADVLRICSAYPAVRRARVAIDKPHALRFADSVSVTLHYVNAEAGQAHIQPRQLRLLEKAS